MNKNNNYMNDYIYKVEAAFISLCYNFDCIKTAINIDINNIEEDIRDFNYELFELELRLRALRDKLNESEIL
jgi:hypothetical protein